MNSELKGAFASAAATAIVLVVWSSLGTQAAGPSTFTAPFVIVDGAGRPLMKVEAWEDRGGGAVVSLYNAAGRGVAQIGASPSGCCGTVRVFDGADNAQPKALLGVDTDYNGALHLAGPERAVTQVSGKGLVVANADRKPVAILRSADDRGYLELRNDSGDVSANLRASEVGGIVEINEASGNPAIKLDAVAGPGKMTMFGNGAPKTTVGASADDAGLIVLNSGRGNSVLLHGVGAVKTMNPSGREVVDLGVDPSGNGIVDVRHSSGVGGVRLDVSETGAGNVKIHTPPFTIKAQIGTKGEKGDVCVEGGKGLICLSGIALKSLIPW